MGVQGLWEILQNVKKTRNLIDLEGETIAIDLATWICEAECVGPMKDTVLKPYLRNLFFRVIKLIRNGVKLVFVTDGKAPQLKWETMARRLDARSDIPQSSNKARGSRSRLNARFNECCALLDKLGICWLKSDGEAEATCAALNMVGMVDACVTNDGDAFLYGATKVYRNLASDKKDLTVECYELREIKQQLNLDRNSLISLGLILGCDYLPHGIPGVGQVQALKLLRLWKGKNPLEEMMKWRNKSITNFQDVKKPSHCSTCKHTGSKRDHSRSGCTVCKSSCAEGSPVLLECTCDWHLNEAKRKNNSLEDGIMRKANKIPQFPNQEIIEEFQRERKCGNLRPQRTPSLDGVVEYMKVKLDWAEEYGAEKSLPLVTYWVLKHPKEERKVSLQSIIRTRTRDGVPVFEVKWSTPSYGEMVTLEPQMLVQSAFPNLVKEFHDKTEREKQEKKTKKKSTVAPKVQPKDSSAKLTDFFKTKKQRPDMKHIATTQDIDSIIDSMGRVNISRASQDGEKLISDTTSEKPHQQDNLKLAAILDCKPAKSKVASDETHCTNAKIERELASVDCNITRDVSFDLNFSLGNSLLKTPQLKENQSPSTGNRWAFSEDKPSSDEDDTSSSCVHEVNMLKTPQKEQIETDPASPVFMSLMERIRLKSET